MIYMAAPSPSQLAECQGILSSGCTRIYSGSHLSSHPPWVSLSLCSPFSATVRSNTVDIPIHMSSLSGLFISVGCLAQARGQWEFALVLIWMSVASLLC